jgi:hypothetical protein
MRQQLLRCETQARTAQRQIADTTIQGNSALVENNLSALNNGSSDLAAPAGDLCLISGLVQVAVGFIFDHVDPNRPVGQVIDQIGSNLE